MLKEKEQVRTEQETENVTWIDFGGYQIFEFLDFMWEILKSEKCFLS